MPYDLLEQYPGPLSFKGALSFLCHGLDHLSQDLPKNPVPICLGECVDDCRLLERICSQSICIGNLGREIFRGLWRSHWPSAQM
jgi:hypothetical protein